MTGNGSDDNSGLLPVRDHAAELAFAVGMVLSKVDGAAARDAARVGAMMEGATTVDLHFTQPLSMAMLMMQSACRRSPGMRAAPMAADMAADMAAAPMAADMAAAPMAADMAAAPMAADMAACSLMWWEWVRERLAYFTFRTARKSPMDSRYSLNTAAPLLLRTKDWRRR
eukprot:gene38065-24887_t